jgi:hypothetical protein
MDYNSNEVGLIDISHYKNDLSFITNQILKHLFLT